MQSTATAAQEPVLYPDQPVVDAHHHLWDTPPLPGYPQFNAGTLVETIRDSGHRVIATVFVEAALTAYRSIGPEHMRGVGETE